MVCCPEMLILTQEKKRTPSTNHPFFFVVFPERRKANHAPKWFVALDEDEKDQIEVVLEDILDLNNAVTQLKNEFNITQSTKEVASLIAYLESPARKRAKEVNKQICYFFFS